VFDHPIAVVLYEMCLEAETATITAVEHSPRSKYKPLPLSTVRFQAAMWFSVFVPCLVPPPQVEMQKRASRYLRLSAEKTMALAESLYNKGWVWGNAWFAAVHARQFWHVWGCRVQFHLVSSHRNRGVQGGYGSERIGGATLRSPHLGTLCSQVSGRGVQSVLFHHVLVSTVDCHVVRKGFNGLEMARKTIKHIRPSIPQNVSPPTWSSLFRCAGMSVLRRLALAVFTFQVPPEAAGLYEMITRMFLAACSQDAKGAGTGVACPLFFCCAA
jgi:hypothetical protein